MWAQRPLAPPHIRMDIRRGGPIQRNLGKALTDGAIAPKRTKVSRVRKGLTNPYVSVRLRDAAKRAKQTAVLVKEIAEVSKPVKFDERIYEASPLTLFNLICEFDEKWESVLIVGHNPGFENLVRMLTGESVSMPTAALARINLDIENWSRLETNSNELEFLIRPKEEMKKSVAN